MHAATARPGWHLLLCGPTAAWPEPDLAHLGERHADLITIHHLATTPTPGALQDPDGLARRRLGPAAGDNALYLVRPDGHIGYRCGGHDLTGLRNYLRRWLPAVTSGAAS